MNNTPIMNQIKSDVNAMFNAAKAIEGVQIIEQNKPFHNHVIINDVRAFSFKLNNTDITIFCNHKYFAHTEKFNVKFNELVLVINDFILNADYEPVIKKGMFLENKATGERVEVLNNYTEMDQYEALFNVVVFEDDNSHHASAENLVLAKYKVISNDSDTQTDNSKLVNELAQELLECRNSLEAAHQYNDTSRAVKDHINGLQEWECEILDNIHESGLENEVMKKAYGEAVC
ncbi:hypothetical protein [Priestia megaterium]|uniref:hypothetical protein n=1 Tax=Priestia megaterium TaxID=1404 RepID=UPI0028773416|nr:hypothetical protein [Priestia megaterium]